jgi:uncharacterized protein YjdB
MKKTRVLYSMLITLSLLCFNATAQLCGGYNPSPDDCKTCISVKMPPTPTICPGASFSFTPFITVPPGFSVKNYSWSGTTVTPPAGTGLPPFTTITPPVPASPPPCSIVPYSYTLYINALAPNVVQNPDFSAGNIDFCTQYYYNPTPSSLITTEYSICSNANVLPGWGSTPPNFFDHTSGTPAGRMLVAQGDANVNEIWVQTVPVCPGESYDFSFWQATLHTSLGFPTTYAELYVSIMDAVGSVTTYGPFTNSTFDSWAQGTLSWGNPSGASYTSAKIFITGGGPTPGPWSIMPWGTAFAIDDISFNRVCKTITRFDINVEYPEILGGNKVCVGSSIALSGCPAGGTWSSSAGVTVDAFGNVTGVTPGAATITYTSPNGCVTTKNITVNALTPISGPTSVCVGSSIVWGSGTAGYWSSTGHLSYYGWTPATSKSFYALSPGIATIYFTDPATGCTTSANVTVNPRPAAIPYSYICIGTSITLSTTPPGGTWSIAPGTVASINPITGLVTGLSAGVATVTYTLPTGCSITTLVYVYNCGNGSGVVGGNLCQGQSRTFFVATGIPSGGVWMSSDITVATVDPVTGVVTAVGSGPVVISYTAGGITWFINITVIPPATAAVTVTCCPYIFHFTSTCSSSALIQYRIEDYLGATIGWGTTGVGSISLSTIVATYPSATRICVYGVWCNGCWWPVNDCASVNPASPKTNSVGSIEHTEHSLAIVPNPNRGTFNITGTLANMNTSGDVKIEVIDMLGKTLYAGIATAEKGMLNKSISLSSSVTNGIYYVRIMNNDGATTLKFVLDR